VSSAPAGAAARIRQAAVTPKEGRDIAAPPRLRTEVSLVRVVSDNPTVPGARARFLDGILLALLGAALAFQLLVPPIVSPAASGS
jgi:hypothetical protein